jgi:hypothetical protein
MRTFGIILCTTLAACWAVGDVQAWSYYTYVTVDSCYPNGDGDANTWSYTPDSSGAHWKCVNEEAENTGDYVYYSTATPTDEWFQVAIDTTNDYDSLRLIGYTLASSGTKRVEAKFDTSGNDVVLDSLLSGNDSYNKTTTRSIDVSGWRNGLLDSLEIGLMEYDGVPSLGYVRVDWYFVEAFRSVSTDSNRWVFHDTTDFRVFQMGEAAAQDDKWTLAACTLGAVGGNEVALGVWLDKDAIYTDPDPDKGSGEIDSVKLHLGFSGVTGNVWGYNLNAILSDESDDHHDASDANDVTGEPRHMEWNNRVSFWERPDTQFASDVVPSPGTWIHSHGDSADYQLLNEGTKNNADHLKVDSVVQLSEGVEAEQWVHLGADTTLWDNPPDSVFLSFGLNYQCGHDNGAPQDSIHAVFGYRFGGAGSKTWYDSLYVIEADGNHNITSAKFTGWTNANVESLWVGMRVKEQMYTGGGSTDLQWKWAIAPAWVRSDSTAWTAAGCKGWGTDMFLSNGDTTSSERSTFDVSMDVREWQRSQQRGAGYTGPAWVLHSDNGDTTGNHYYAVAGGQPFVSSGDSTYMEIFWNTDSSYCYDCYGFPPDSADWPADSARAFTGDSVMALGGMSEFAGLDNYWNENAVVFGNYNGNMCRILLALRDTSFITGGDSIPLTAIIDSAYVYLFKLGHAKRTNNWNQEVMVVSRDPTYTWAVFSANPNNVSEPEDCAQSNWTNRRDDTDGGPCTDSTTEVAWLTGGAGDTICNGTCTSDSVDAYSPDLDTAWTYTVGSPLSSIWIRWEVTEWIDAVFRGTADTGNSIIFRGHAEDTNKFNVTYRTEVHSDQATWPHLLVYYHDTASAGAAQPGRRRRILIGQEDSCGTQSYSQFSSPWVAGAALWPVTNQRSPWPPSQSPWAKCGNWWATLRGRSAIP